MSAAEMTTGNPAAEARRPALDIKHLPDAVLDHRSPVWWGNLLLLFIESTMFALLTAAYFYVRNNFQVWPPPQVNQPFANLNAVPDLPIASLNLFFMLLSIIPTIIFDLAAHRRRWALTTIMLGIVILIDVACIYLRCREFAATNVKWNDNAYASVLWTILGMHLIHLAVCGGEMFLMFIWLVVKGLDDKHARDTRCSAVYWYWVVAIWVPLYFMIYVGPRIP